MHVYQSYNVSLCSCFGARTLHSINNLGLCIRVKFSHGNMAYVMIMLFINIELFMIDNYLSVSYMKRCANVLV